jgi:hypothetical protein
MVFSYRVASGMNDRDTVIEATRAKPFEGSMMYRTKGTDKSLMLVEGLGSSYCRADTSDRLDGEWTPISDDAYDRPFCRNQQREF